MREGGYVTQFEAYTVCKQSSGLHSSSNIKFSHQKLVSDLSQLLSAMPILIDRLVAMMHCAHGLYFGILAL